MNNNNDTNQNGLNSENEFLNSVPEGPEIEQPNPSTATPSIPQEIPIRE